jgi:hypothetical protein
MASLAPILGRTPAVRIENVLARMQEGGDSGDGVCGAVTFGP